MFAQIASPGSITGAPISWLLGGNPFLDGVWLFANGVICFHQGYKFFMIALADQEEVKRVVREIKGLLPAASLYCDFCGFAAHPIRRTPAFQLIVIGNGTKHSANTISVMIPITVRARPSGSIFFGGGCRTRSITASSTT